jgi:hypothetical protein
MGADVMVGFGGKQAWLAVKATGGDDPAGTVPAVGDDPAGTVPVGGGDPAGVVLAALGLRDLGPVPWRDGIDLAHLTDDRVAVTPPLHGWVLVTGRWLLRPDNPVDVVGLSARLGTEVQFFATHRVTELHRWQRAVDGELIRAFGYVGQTGEVITWYGEPGPAEREAGLPGALDEDAIVLVGEKDVLRVAGAWSIDPTTLTGRPAPGPLRIGAAS